MFHLPLPINVNVSIFIFLTLTPNISFLLTAILQHTIISPIHDIGYTAFLNTLHGHFW